MNQASLVNSKYSRGSEHGLRSWGSGLDAGGGGSPATDLSSARTFVTTKADQVAVIERMILTWPGSEGAATTNVTVTIGSQTMQFVGRAVASRVRSQQITLRPKGTLLVPPSTSATIVASAGSYAANAFIQYRLLDVQDAIARGIYRGGFWCATSGTIAVANTAQNITGFTAADVGANRRLVIRGMCITGFLSGATSAANQEILLESTDGAGTNRKVFKQCFATAEPEQSLPTIIDECNLHLAMGHGLRVTAGTTGTGAQIAVWGEYATYQNSVQNANEPGIGWSGKGTIPGATDPFDPHTHWWSFTESTTASVAEFFPQTTCANMTDTYVIDGFAANASGPNGSAAQLGIGTLSPFQIMSGIMPSGLPSTAGVGTAAAYTITDLAMTFRYNDKIGHVLGVPGGAIGKRASLAWGRRLTGGSGLSTTHVSKRYAGGT